MVAVTIPASSKRTIKPAGPVPESSSPLTSASPPEPSAAEPSQPPSQAAHESTLDLNLNSFTGRDPPSPPPVWPRSITPPPRSVREFRRANGHIKRPSNAFMLFRSHVTKQKDYPYNHDSRMIARVWSNLPHEVRDRWHQSAEEEKEDLLRHFPDYKYQPVHDKGKRAQKKKKEEERKVKRIAMQDARKVKQQQAMMPVVVEFSPEPESDSDHVRRNTEALMVEFQLDKPNPSDAFTSISPLQRDATSSTRGLSSISMEQSISPPLPTPYPAPPPRNAHLATQYQEDRWSHGLSTGRGSEAMDVDSEEEDSDEDDHSYLLTSSSRTLTPGNTRSSRPSSSPSARSYRESLSPTHESPMRERLHHFRLAPNLSRAERIPVGGLVPATFEQSKSGSTSPPHSRSITPTPDSSPMSPPPIHHHPYNHYHPHSRPHFPREMSEPPAQSSYSSHHHHRLPPQHLFNGRTLPEPLPSPAERFPPLDARRHSETVQHHSKRELNLAPMLSPNAPAHTFNKNLPSLKAFLGDAVSPGTEAMDNQRRFSI